MDRRDGGMPISGSGQGQLLSGLLENKVIAFFGLDEKLFAEDPICLEVRKKVQKSFLLCHRARWFRT